MRRIKLLLVLFIVITKASFAQIPHLKGEIKISILNGTIEGDLEYSNLPTLKNYNIWLNTGLNVRYFRDEADKFNYENEKYYDSEKSEEAFQYYFPDKDKKGKILPSKFKINYVGKFPVIIDTLRASNRNDWKGNLAFNGKTIRASEQTCWYPVLYDIDNDLEINKVTYDLKIDCIDCESIYVNGSYPIKGKSASFKANDPTAIMIYAGLFDFTKK